MFSLELEKVATFDIPTELKSLNLRKCLGRIKYYKNQS